MLRITGMGSYSYDDIEIIYVDTVGLVFFGDIVITHATGQFIINCGFISFDGSHEIMPVPGIVIAAEGNRASGDNWEIELNEGYMISETASGSYIIIATAN
jgi:hypothetical protein